MPPRIEDEDDDVCVLVVVHHADDVSIQSNSSMSLSSTTGSTTTTHGVLKTNNKIKNHAKGKIARRSVTFDEQVRGLNTLHFNDYTENEKRSCWYTSTELVTIRKDARKSVMMACSSTTVATTSFQDETDIDIDVEFHTLYRGLENFTDHGMKVKKYHRDHSRNVVLQEQERQRSMDDYDPDYISYLYATNDQTIVCQTIASKLGIHDEIQAMI